MLTSVFRRTTGEARLLQITGLTDGDSVLVAGTRIDTPGGTVIADDTAAYAIRAAKASASLKGRPRIYPLNESMPEVVYLGDVRGEIELLDAGSVHESITCS